MLIRSLLLLVVVVFVRIMIDEVSDGCGCGCMLAVKILSIGSWGDNGRSSLCWLPLLVGGDGDGVEL